MKLSRLLLPLTCGLMIAVQAQLQISTLPTCALNCLISSIPKSSCSLTDTSCMCSDATLLHITSTCVTSNCTVKEGLITENITQNACGFEAGDRRIESMVITSVFLGIAMIAVCLKLLTHIPAISAKPFGIEDWCIVAASASCIAAAIMIYLMLGKGLGKDIWTIPFNDITLILKWFFVAEIFYMTTQTLARLSFLFFYLNIFPARDFRRLVYIVMAYTIAHWIVFFLVVVLQCNPVSYAWTRWDGEQTGTCINLNAAGWAHAASNMVLDALIVILPMRPLSQLVLSRRKKFHLMTIFGLGFFITIASIIRLQTLIEFGDTENPTWDYIPVLNWSVIEVDVTIFCVCLPAIRALFKRYKVPTFASYNASFAQPSRPKIHNYKSGTHTSDPGGNSKTIEQSVTVHSSEDSHSDTLELVSVDKISGRRPSTQIG